MIQGTKIYSYTIDNLPRFRNYDDTSQHKNQRHWNKSLTKRGTKKNQKREKLQWLSTSGNSLNGSSAVIERKSTTILLIKYIFSRKKYHNQEKRSVITQKQEKTIQNKFLEQQFILVPNLDTAIIFKRILQGILSYEIFK